MGGDKKKQVIDSYLLPITCYVLSCYQLLFLRIVEHELAVDDIDDDGLVAVDFTLQ